MSDDEDASRSIQGEREKRLNEEDDEGGVREKNGDEEELGSEGTGEIESGEKFMNRFFGKLF